MGHVHRFTAARAAPGWVEESRSSPGSTIYTSASPTITNLNCVPIGDAPASGGTSCVAQSANPIPPTCLGFVGRRA